MISDNIKERLEKAIEKAAKEKNYSAVSTLEKMVAGSLPINYVIIDSILDEESPYQKNRFLDTDNDGYPIDESVSYGYSKSKFLNKDVPEMIKSLESTLSFLKHYSGQKEPIEYLNTLFNDISYNADKFSSECARMLEYQGRGALSESELKIVIKQPWGAEIKDYKDGDPVPSGKKFKIFNASDTDKIDSYADSLFEGCMDKKFSRMTNEEIASYIFHHPHTKFGEKIKECDTKNLMNAIRKLKNENVMNEDGEGVSDAPTTTTSAVEMPELPWGLAKRKNKR